MYKFKLKKDVKKLSPMENLINESIDKLTFELTSKCYNKETCTSVHKRKNKNCLNFCKRLVWV